MVVSVQSDRKVIWRKMSLMSIAGVEGDDAVA